MLLLLSASGKWLVWSRLNSPQTSDVEELRFSEDQRTALRFLKCLGSPIITQFDSLHSSDVEELRFIMVR